MNVKYVAQVEHVREASLIGAADLAFWRERLAGERLTAVERDGRAQVMLSASQGRFRGVAFRELSVCIAVCESDQAQAAGAPDGWYMVHAFNSLRLFAWVERTMFSTPYYHGRIRVSAAWPAMMEVVDGESRFSAAMESRAGAAPAADGSGRLARSGVEGFEGWIYLPTPSGAQAGRGKRFYAKISGLTRAYAFDPQRDEVTVTPSRWPVFEWLTASHFTGV